MIADLPFSVNRSAYGRTAALLPPCLHSKERRFIPGMNVQGFPARVSVRVGTKPGLFEAIAALHCDGKHRVLDEAPFQVLLASVDQQFTPLGVRLMLLHALVYLAVAEVAPTNLRITVFSVYQGMCYTIAGENVPVRCKVTFQEDEQGG
jgi:hypothetical protein